MTFFSWGTVAGVWVTALGPNECAVRVITLRRLATSAATVLTEKTFHERFRLFVGG
jgi:hypothetical protein